ncbi:hypothetical protein [Microbacterium sp. 2MCAF23]|uniref:hypothetical protein n=1 Tax=Microbacterium sp. 2MCAF23 TaxID=3232985 RepID=UPI003F9A2715
MTADARPPGPPVRGVPRGLVIARAWERLSGVDALTGPTGAPLARTTKLVLDPLVIRPSARPHLAYAVLSDDAAEELEALIDEARSDLAATAAWFVALKRARRRAAITGGNPQDLYFQRAFELARHRGAPAHDADAVAAATLAEVHDGVRPGLAELRAHLSDPAVATQVSREIAEAWARAAAPAGPVVRDALRRLLDACATGAGTGDFAALVASRSGSAGAPPADLAGAARELGLTAKDLPSPPDPGSRATKTAMPPPFDRSLFERLFASFAAVADSGGDIGDVVHAEIQRTAGAWQLTEEESRVVLLAATEASAALGDPAGSTGSGVTPAAAESTPHAMTDAARRLGGRWRREPFVHRALRLGENPAPARGAREAFVRRLWARLHGRELRGDAILADEVWTLLDGALRSVILDRRGLVKASIGRDALEEAA